MRRVRGAAALGVLVLLAVGLRAHRLGLPALWVDEAESAINALTIVASGVPGDRFLRQPLYENTLVRPWPESPEYEFRDVSYSDRGLAVYHGWLPLYAIAAAFRLAGVTPEQARHGTPLRDATPDEIVRWTAVPRWPSVVFSALFVVAAYGLGRAVHGPPAGWALATAAAVSHAFVWYGRQARYYSATLAASAACGLAIWNACRRGRTSDHVLVGLAVGVLFHVHSLSAVTLGAVYVAALPLARRQPRLWLRVLAAGAVGGVLVVPWAFWSGLLAHTAYVPAARQFLDLPTLLWSLPRDETALHLTATLGLAWFGAARLGARLPDRWRRPIIQEGAGIYFAVSWLVLSYVVFVAFIPAASYYAARFKLLMAVPALLLDTLVVAAASRAIRPASRILPTVGITALLGFAGQLPPRPVPASLDRGFAEFLGLVRSWRLGPEGRVVAGPNDHLILTYYGGRVVQSVAAFRREWLERFKGDLIVVEAPWFDVVGAPEAQEIARDLGRDLTAETAKEMAEEAQRRATALDLLASGAHVVDPPRKGDDLGEALVEATRRRTRHKLSLVLASAPLQRFTRVSNSQDYRHHLVYWFSDPDRRSGAGLNYRACRDRARVQVHASGFVVYDCRASPGAPLLPDEAGLAPQP